MPGRNRKIEQGDATRQALVSSAISLFTQQGYATASTSGIVARAQVTRGALYHHFPDKERLFRAALDTVEEDVYQRVRAAIATSEPGIAARIRTGASAFLDACLDRPVQRILLQEGPAVLGWQRWHQMDNPHCARRLLADGIAEAIRGGVLPAQPAEPVTHLLYGALVQAGLVIAGSDDPESTRDAVVKAAQIMLDSMFSCQVAGNVSPDITRLPRPS
jgi:AcrR family transcriptional regulator